MLNEIQTANVEAEPSSMVKTNTSILDFATARARQLGAKIPEQEQEQSVPEEVAESEQEVPEFESDGMEGGDEVTTEDNVLSKNLDDYSEEELRELSEKLGSRAVARFGELTAKRKAAEEKLAQLEASLNQKNEDPLERKSVTKDNPYKDIDSIEGLQDKAQEANSIIEWAEDILFNSDEYSASDVVVEVEGKELTKAEVRNSLKNARKSRDLLLPEQLKVIQARQHGEQMKEAFKARANEELPWMAGEDNDTRKHYEAMVTDPRFEQLSKNLEPDIAAQLPYILAHAANSLYGKKEVQQKASPRLTPPNSSFSNAAQSSRPAAKSDKAIKEMESRFKQSGDKKDFITLRTLQLSNKK